MKKLANSVIICKKKTQNDNSTCHTHFVSFDVRNIVTNNLGSTCSLFMHGLICMCQYQNRPLGVFELFDNFVSENTHQLCLYHLLLKCINPYWSFYWSSCLCCFLCWSLISEWYQNASFFVLLFSFHQDIDDLTLFCAQMLTVNVENSKRFCHHQIILHLK